MNRWINLSVMIFVIVCLSTPCLAGKYDGKKVLFIDSYHEGYGWSDGITKGIETTLDGSGVELNIVRMDTKRNTDDAFKKKRP